MVQGPCGPCTEIYYDRGPEYGCNSPTCGVGCDCDRYMEFWNLVLTQFDAHEDGTYTELEHKNVDTGMGLERMATIMQGVDSIFDVDTVKYIREVFVRRQAWNIARSIRLMFPFVSLQTISAPLQS